MQILIHACCAPCLIVPLLEIKEEGKDATCYFYNPNIHPHSEFVRRLEMTDSYCKIQGVSLIYEKYDPVQYFRYVSQNLEKPERCHLCYQVRMERAAGKARELGFSAYTTTLLVSPYQEHHVIKAIGDKAGSKFGINFYYKDWRNEYREGVIKSKNLEMYRQKYCGCLFSEKERYAK